MNRIEILKASLAKKEQQFDVKLAKYFESVRDANGQPLNDKRNGRATLDRWDKQNDALRSLQESIEVTKRAIDREEMKIAAVAAVTLPEPIAQAIAEGKLRQWRKHPNTFFVEGVDRGRIVWDGEKRVIGHRYLSEVTREQYPIFRDAYNGLQKALQDA